MGSFSVGDVVITSKYSNCVHLSEPGIVVDIKESGYLETQCIWVYLVLFPNYSCTPVMRWGYDLENCNKKPSKKLKDGLNLYRLINTK